MDKLEPLLVFGLFLVPSICFYRFCRKSLLPWWRHILFLLPGSQGAALAEGIAPTDARAAVTRTAAWQYFEEREKGTIAPGKKADFVILNRDPLAVPPEALREIQVVETIKEGRSLFTL